MKKLLYIGHTFHRTTRSNEFFLKLLKGSYEVTTLFVDPDVSSRKWDCSKIAGKDFDVVVIWQILFPIRLLRSLVSFRTGICIPMMDGYARGPARWYRPRWAGYAKFRFVSFCRQMHEDLVAHGYDSRYVKYYPEIDVGDGASRIPDSGFFWYRRPPVTAEVVKSLCDKLGIRHLHLHDKADPNCPPCNIGCLDEIIAAHTTWFDDQAQMKDCVRRCIYYFAPREYEGIGMGFLEAMAMGCIVVAPNRPTMSEYIEDGKTGFLYDVDTPDSFAPVHIDVVKMRNDIIASIEKGQWEWRQEAQELISLLDAPIEEFMRSRHEAEGRLRVMKRSFK